MTSRDQAIRAAILELGNIADIASRFHLKNAGKDRIVRKADAIQARLLKQFPEIAESILTNDRVHIPKADTEGRTE